jgi:hypothetical protein
MGDIVQKIKVAGMTLTGGMRDERTVNALIDPGTSKTVITSSLAREIKAAEAPAYAIIEGQHVPMHLAALRLSAPKCGVDVIAVAVSDSKMARAGRPNGLHVDVILGHDYLQNQRVNLQYAGSSDEQTVACRVEKKRARR